MSVAWTLQYLKTGETKSFEDWGIDQVSATRSRLDQSIDKFTFQMSGQIAMTDEVPFADGESCIIFRDAVRWFYGRVTRVQRSGSGRDESIKYELSGPWWYLANLSFRQDWNLAVDPDDPASGLVPTPRNRVLLGHTLAGTKQATGLQIAECVNYAIDAGAPIQIGTIDGGVQHPVDEHKGLTVAEAVQILLRLSPDATAWFDYSTAPYPSFNVARWAGMAEVNLPVTVEQCETAEIMPRYDLLVPGVIIEYERTHSLNEKTWRTMEIDKSGADTFGSIVAPIELGGSSKTLQIQQLENALLDASSADFWKSVIPRLNDAGVTGLIVENPSPASPTNYVIAGAVPEWLPTLATPLTVTAEISYTIVNANGASEKREKELVSVQVLTTTLGSIGVHTFERITSQTDEEELPVGLAAHLHSGLSILHYEGSHTIIAEDVGDIALGSRLNLTGGRGEWTTMRAMVKAITEEIGLGRTTIRFGPPQHLTVQEMVNHLRTLREKVPSYHLDERVTGKSFGNGAQVAGAIATPVQNSNGAASGVAELKIKKDDGISPRAFSFNPADIPAGCTSDLIVREMPWCDVDGSGNPITRKVAIVMSLPYD